MKLTRFIGDSVFGGWVVAWTGVDGIHYPQKPELRVRSGPIEIRVETPSPYLVASIADDEGVIIHYIALNPAEG